MFRDRLNLEIEGVVEVIIRNKKTKEIIKTIKLNNVLPGMYETIAYSLERASTFYDASQQYFTYWQPLFLKITGVKTDIGNYIQEFTNPDDLNSPLKPNGEVTWKGYGTFFSQSDVSYPTRIVLKKSWLLTTVNQETIIEKLNIFCNGNRMMSGEKAMIETNEFVLNNNPIVLDEYNEAIITWRLLL